MKKLLFVLCSAAIVAFFITSCKPNVDATKEKDAIKAVIDAETQAWLDKNGKQFAECYVVDSNTWWAGVSDSNVWVENWKKDVNYADTISNFNFSDYKDYKFTHEVLASKIIGNVAWVLVKNHQNFVFKGVATRNEEFKTMVLEKIDGKWKISLFVAANIPVAPPPPPPPPVEKKK